MIEVIVLLIPVARITIGCCLGYYARLPTMVFSLVYIRFMPVSLVISMFFTLSKNHLLVDIFTNLSMMTYMKT